MSSVPWEGDYVRPTRLHLTDEEYDRVERDHPGVVLDSERGCPTCGGAKEYFWRGEIRQCDCYRQVALHKNYLKSNIGELYQRLSWDDFNGDAGALAGVQDWVRKHRDLVRDGMGLLLRGKYGTGKTMLAALAAKEAVKLGYSVYVITFAEMVEEFTAGWRDNDEKRRFERVVVQCDVLVLDDIGKEFKAKSNNLAESTFDHVLRRRVASLRPTITTTNLSTREMEDGYGAGVLSLLRERSVEIAVTGGDFRRQARDRYAGEVGRGERRPIT